MERTGLVVLVAALIMLANVDTAAAQQQHSGSELHLESSFWGPYGVAIVKDGETIETGMFMGGLVDAVDGSTAKSHARNARGWSMANTTLAAVGAGLLVADIFVYEDRFGTLDGWPNIIPATQESVSLFPFALVAGTGAVVCRYMAYEEMAISVSVHNSGLSMSGKF